MESAAVWVPTQIVIIVMRGPAIYAFTASQGSPGISKAKRQAKEDGDTQKTQQNERT